MCNKGKEAYLSLENKTRNVTVAIEPREELTGQIQKAQLWLLQRLLERSKYLNLGGYSSCASKSIDSCHIEQFKDVAQQTYSSHAAPQLKHSLICRRAEQACLLTHFPGNNAKLDRIRWKKHTFPFPK